MRPPRHLIGPRSLRASGDRWLFGYADVVTLLFACFAALYATQLEPVTGAPAAPPPPPPVVVAAAPTPTPTPTPDSTPTPTPTPEPEPAPVVVSPPAWTQEIAALAAAEEQIHLDLTAGAGGTVISLAEAGSFLPGRADLSPAARRVIGQLAGLLRDRAEDLRIEGHTDDSPIRASQYASNWELSTARASRVVEFLITEASWPPDRLSAAGYGEFRPKVANDGPKARARNRRVDIVVLDPRPAQADSRGADYRPVGVRPSDGR